MTVELLTHLYRSCKTDRDRVRFDELQPSPSDSGVLDGVVR